MKTRWDSTCHMLIRTHDLRYEITQFCQDYSIIYLLLDNDEWSQIEYLIDLLKSFCLFTKVLSSTRTFTINMIFKIYNRLFEHLKKTSQRLARKRVSWKKSLMKTLKTTQEKLIKYYNQTQNDLELCETTILMSKRWLIVYWLIYLQRAFWRFI
jgi:viroplasmin and RNaseH domain-containing protein